MTARGGVGAATDPEAPPPPRTSSSAWLEGAAAQVAHLPGMAFVVAAVVSWGPALGGLIGWLGAVLAVCASFVVVRSVGGRAPAKLSRPRLEKLLAAVERRPIRTVMVLRMVFW